MLVRNAIVVRVAVGALLTLSAGAALSAQTTVRASTTSATTDARWTPWLGCWQSDTTGAGASGISIPTTCVVPVAGASSVEALSIVDGQIASRRSLIADGKPHPMDQSGCHGDETANWSPTSRRIYLHATYVCAAGLQGTSSSVFAIAPNGDWLEVQNVRAGGGSLDRTLRWHDAPPPRGLSRAVATHLVSQRLAIATARAAVARPLGTDDVIEATRAVDAATVQSWLVATGQRFTLDDAQIATLASANVPPSIVRLMAGVDQSAAGADAGERQRVDDYLNGYSLPDDGYGASTVLPVNPYSAYNGYGSYVPYTPYTPYPAYGYPTYGYNNYGYGGYGYPVPIVVVHGQSHGGVNGVGRGRPIDGGHPNPPGPVGRPPMIHPPVGRPAGAQPPVPRPPVAHMPEAAHAPVARQPAAAPARTRP